MTNSGKNTKGSLRILVVDDEDFVRGPLIAALQFIGYQATGAANVDEALDQLENNTFDMLFCDLVMPGANGFTLMEVARRKWPAMAIVVLTGHGTIDLTQRAMRTGAQDFVIKPFSVRELPIIVERNVERRRLEAQLRERQTENLLFQTVQALTAAIEAKDPYTAGHSWKVSYLSIQFANTLELGQTDIFALRLAGMMHDVGKIGIPESVLRKPSRLNEQEWEIMKQHPIIGAEIVGQISDLKFVAKIVRSHHERWDGTGYPEGLKEEQIPFLARILNLSDAFDALTADRAYRKGLTDQQALEIIKQQSGIHFDEEMVTIFENQIFPGLSETWRNPNELTAKLSSTVLESLSVQQKANP
jgi:putative two-component system response regulator